jgi:RHS repeat-associated protein
MDHYAFGMGMPGRTISSVGGYRFGFNGKENDNDVKGNGNQQDYGLRIYDPRLGKFLSVDPLTKEYPELTPYQFASNTPVQAIDLDGGEKKDKAGVPTGKAGITGVPDPTPDSKRNTSTKYELKNIALNTDFAPKDGIQTQTVKVSELTAVPAHKNGGKPKSGPSLYDKAYNAASDLAEMLSKTGHPVAKGIDAVFDVKAYDEATDDLARGDIAKGAVGILGTIGGEYTVVVNAAVLWGKSNRVQSDVWVTADRQQRDFQVRYMNAVYMDDKYGGWGSDVEHWLEKIREMDRLKSDAGELLREGAK